jgi:hypothetical protein
VVELDFDTLEAAEACTAALGRLWESRTAAPALVGRPRTRIVETVDRQEYATDVGDAG